MPYDPIRDAPGFRLALKRLAEVERLTSQAIVDLFNKQRARGDTLSISRATLDRFVAGEDTTKIRELRVIHTLLLANPAYCRYFETSAPPPPASPAGDLAAGCLFPDWSDGDMARTGDMLAALPGEFVLMRRDHDPISVEQGVRVSMLSLVETGIGIAIRENQNYRTPDDEMAFEQTDRGHVFSHGQKLYFLMKEDGGTAVKFGVIEQTLPEIERRQPVQYFQGHVMVVSRRGVFPRTRFAARRFSPNQHPATSGIVRLAEIADARAVEHLRLDYIDGSAARPA
jgi:hypothetical protein